MNPITRYPSALGPIALPKDKTPKVTTMTV